MCKLHGANASHAHPAGPRPRHCPSWGQAELEQLQQVMTKEKDEKEKKKGKPKEEEEEEERPTAKAKKAAPPAKKAPAIKAL